MNKNILYASVLLGALLIGTGIYMLFYGKQSTPSIYLNTQNNQQNDGKIITIPSNVMWFDTGIDLSKNTTLKIDYQSGQWRNTHDSNYCNGQGKIYNGQNRLIVPSALLAALVAKVGGNTFTVGNSFEGKAGSGRLYLSLNDVPNTYDDNDGELVVSITVQSVGGQSTLNVPMDTPWTSTGVKINAGQILTISATGKGVWKNIRNNPNSYPSPFEECDPNGTPPVDSKDYYSNISSYLARDAYKGALIGKVGGSGKPFKVGSNFNGVINETGILYFGINDQRPDVDPNAFADNSGSYSAQITVR